MPDKRPPKTAYSYPARDAGGSGNKKDIVDETSCTNKIIDLLSPASESVEKTFRNQFALSLKGTKLIAGSDPERVESRRKTTRTVRLF